jgi:hypothetical protein
MPATTQCPNCGVVLTLPPGAEGRRLKCPKCATRFPAENTQSRPPSSHPGMAGPAPSSPAPGHPAPASSILGTPVSPDPLIPLADHDLRDTFDLPMMMGGTTAPASPQRADAVALFRDDEPAQPRRKGGAEARSRARKCTKCGSLVPAGMSLCEFCGLDLDTGIRVAPDEELFAAPPIPKAPPLPIGVGIVGGITALGSVVLFFVALVQWTNQKASQLSGYEFLGVVCAFGIFASIQFLRGKSVKLLLVALTLGAMIDVVGLLVVPVWKASEDAAAAPLINNDPNDEDGQPAAVEPYYERINKATIAWGVALLVLYAVVVFYLLTPGVRRHFERHSRANAPETPVPL